MHKAKPCPPTRLKRAAPIPPTRPRSVEDSTPPPARATRPGEPVERCFESPGPNGGPDPAPASPPADRDTVEPYSESALAAAARSTPTGFLPTVTWHTEAPAPDALGPGDHVLPLPSPDRPDALLWVHVEADGRRTVQPFAFFCEDYEAVLRQVSDPDVARRLVEASRQFNQVLRDGIHRGQNPREVLDAWRRVHLAEALVDGTILAGDGELGPGQALLLLAGVWAVARSLPAAPPVSRRPAPAPDAADPMALFERSAEAIADGFNDAGYLASTRRSKRTSRLATVVTVAGHPTIAQVQVHPGGGRHGGRYVKISTNQEGVIKVVDPRTYRPTEGEKARIIAYTESGP